MSCRQGCPRPSASGHEHRLAPATDLACRGGLELSASSLATTRDLGRATRIASYVGQAVAFAMIAWGASRLLAGDVFGGLWTAFIGWFLNSGAESSRQQLTVHNALDGVPVSTVMDTSPAVAEPGLSVHDFVFEHTLRHGHRALPVVEGGRLVGIVSITDAKHLPHAAWATTPVGEVMTRMPLKTLAPEADLSAALELMVANGVHQLPIVRDGALVGMLSRSDVMRYMQLGAELNLRGSAGSTAAPAESRAAPSRGSRKRCDMHPHDFAAPKEGHALSGRPQRGPVARVRQEVKQALRVG
jgi:CBS domain-containing protein